MPLCMFRQTFLVKYNNSTIFRVFIKAFYRYMLHIVSGDQIETKLGSIVQIGRNLK